MKKQIAIVAPDLENIGGVQSIVEMIVALIEESDGYECKIISLATSAADRLSVRLLSPLSWLQGVRAERRSWRGRTVMHVGCLWSELEFMRYRPRRLLSALLADCAMVQVVGGFPAWGQVVPAGQLPVANWAATRCIWERSTMLRARRCPKELWRRFMTRVVDHIDARAMVQADRRMVMNPLMQDYASTLVPQSSQRVVYAPPGVDTNWFVPASDSLSVHSVPYVLAVGRFGDARKNPELLLDAFSRMRQLIDGPVHLVLAGANGPGEAFWLQADQAGVRADIIFYASPDREALRALYQGASCFALSSNEEGFGMVLVEAMACGVPVVATRCGGPDGIICDGLNGFLVSVGDADALAVRLSQLLSDHQLRREMGRSARQTVLQQFSVEASGKIFLRVWNELTGGGY